MAIKKLQVQYPLPQFDIPEKFKKNEWNIKEWDCFQNSDNNHQKQWLVRSGKTDNKFKFTLCKNSHIAEEYKYVMYYLLEIKKISLGTFADYYDRYKVLAEYVEKYLMNYTSILDLEDINHFEIFLSNRGNKVIVDNGQQFIKQKMVPAVRRNRYSTFIEYSQSILRNYYEKDIPETQKLVWHPSGFPFCDDGDSGRTLDFRTITNPHTLKNVQAFCEYQLNVCNISFKSVYAYLHSIKIFLEWLDKNHSLPDLNKIDRDVIEDYMIYLRTCGTYSSHALNLHILHLKIFFEWGSFHKVVYMPKEILFLNSDYAFKRKIESRYLTDDELRGVISVIPDMPKLYGRMVYCLLFLGVRFSELARLSVDCLKQNDNGTYYIDLWQYKTDSLYEKPVYKNCIKIIQNEIMQNQKRFGKENVKYVFVGKKNIPIQVKTLNDNINKALVQKNILGRDGKILRCTTHRFRATLATNLISEGVAVDISMQLLGHTSTGGFSHYAEVTKESVKKSLKPRLEKDEKLIRNIGKFNQLEDIPTENTVALCNGFCSKEPLTTPCAKANACFSCPLFIPSKQFLNMYEMQLIEVEATIQLARTNDYQLMLQKALEDKDAILNILKRLEKNGGDLNDNERKENEWSKET